MKHIYTERTYPNQNPFIDSIFTKDVLFFDIETTGFSASNSIVYLIGCMYRKNNTLIIEQFFAECKEEEGALLQSFEAVTSTHPTLITFNGTAFDIPFLQTKCKTFDFELFLPTHKHMDIFKLVKELKPLLNLPNYKQKTIEQFLGISRKDTFHGGELISIYETYLKTKDSHLEKLLLLHNFEDICGMFDLLPILTYKEILNGAFTLKNAELCEYLSYEHQSQKEYILTLQNHYCVPKQLSTQMKDCFLIMYKETTKLRIPAMIGELCFFYPNYKDYFYLPQEDAAIHKSVGIFVEKEFRQKAKKSNCYTKRNSIFLPQYKELITPVFRKTYKDTICYFEYNENFSNSPELQFRYATHLCKLFLKTDNTKPF